MNSLRFLALQALSEESFHEISSVPGNENLVGWFSENLKEKLFMFYEENDSYEKNLGLPKTFSEISNTTTFSVQHILVFLFITDHEISDDLFFFLKDILRGRNIKDFYIGQDFWLKKERLSPDHITYQVSLPLYKNQMDSIYLLYYILGLDSSSKKYAYKYFIYALHCELFGVCDYMLQNHGSDVLEKINKEKDIYKYLTLGSKRYYAECIGKFPFDIQKHVIMANTQSTYFPINLDKKGFLEILPEVCPIISKKTTNPDIGNVLYHYDFSREELFYFYSVLEEEGLYDYATFFDTIEYLRRNKDDIQYFVEKRGSSVFFDIGKSDLFLCYNSAIVFGNEVDLNYLHTSFEGKVTEEVIFRIYSDFFYYFPVQYRKDRKQVDENYLSFIKYYRDIIIKHILSSDFTKKQYVEKLLSCNIEYQEKVCEVILNPTEHFPHLLKKYITFILKKQMCDYRISIVCPSILTEMIKCRKMSDYQCTVILIKMIGNQYMDNHRKEDEIKFFLKIREVASPHFQQNLCKNLDTLSKRWEKHSDYFEGDDRPFFVLIALGNLGNIEWFFENVIPEKYQKLVLENLPRLLTKEYCDIDESFYESKECIVDYTAGYTENILYNIKENKQKKILENFLSGKVVTNQAQKIIKEEFPRYRYLVHRLEEQKAKEIEKEMGMEE